MTIPIIIDTHPLTRYVSMNMKNNRRSYDDRRQNKDTLRVPFKDSNGATIRECRRKNPDRRIANIQVEWIDETVIDLDITSH